MYVKGASMRGEGAPLSDFNLAKRKINEFSLQYWCRRGVDADEK